MKKIIFVVAALLSIGAAVYAVDAPNAGARVACGVITR